MSTSMSSQHILQKAQITFSHPLLIKSFFSRREKSSGCSSTLSVPFNKIFLLPPPFSTMASTGKPAEHPDEGPNFGRTEIVYCVAFKETPTVSSIHLRVLGTLGYNHPKILDRNLHLPSNTTPAPIFIGPSATSQPNMQFY